MLCSLLVSTAPKSISYYTFKGLTLWCMVVGSTGLAVPTSNQTRPWCSATVLLGPRGRLRPSPCPPAPLLHLPWELLLKETKRGTFVKTQPLYVINESKTTETPIIGDKGLRFNANQSCTNKGLLYLKMLSPFDVKTSFLSYKIFSTILHC